MYATSTFSRTFFDTTGPKVGQFCPMSEKDYSKSPNLSHFSIVFQFESLKKWVWRIWMLVLLTFYPDSFLVRLEKLFHNNFLTQMKVSFAFFPSHIFFQNWDDFWYFQANFDVFLMPVASKIVSLIGDSFYDQFLSHF